MGGSGVSGGERGGEGGMEGGGAESECLFSSL